MNRLQSDPPVTQCQDESDLDKSLHLEEKPVDLETALLEDFVLFKFENKNSFIYYVGLVLKMEKDELKIKFARKKLGSSLKFVFPDVDDIAHVNIKDIKLKLTCSTISRGLSYDLGKGAKRAISPTLIEENNRVAKSRYTAPPKYHPKNKGIQILDRFDNRVILSSKIETKILPMERETTFSLKEALKPEHFEFELSKDKKRVTIFLPTESAVAKALTIKKIGGTEVKAEEFKPRCQAVIRGIPKEITEEEIKSDLESESNANDIQNGFRQGRSTTDSLLSILRDSLYALNNTKVMILIFLDVKGAFDNIVHRQILNGLVKANIQGTLMNFSIEYMSGREVAVLVGESKSENKEAKKKNELGVANAFAELADFPDKHLEISGSSLPDTSANSINSALSDLDTLKSNIRNDIEKELDKSLHLEEKPIDLETALLEDFVLFKFENKNSFIYYVGLVLKMEKDELKIKFARKKLGSSLKFVFPDVDDIAHVNIKDIKLKLTCSTISRGLSHDLGKGAKRAISPTLIEENNRVAKSRYTAPPKYHPKNKGIQILDRFDNRVILSSKIETKILPMERETTFSLKEALKPEHFEFELSKDKKRVTIFLPTESAVAKALTIKKIGEREVKAEEFKPRCQGVIRGIPKEITEEEIKTSQLSAFVTISKEAKKKNELGVANAFAELADFPDKHLEISGSSLPDTSANSINSALSDLDTLKSNIRNDIEKEVREKVGLSNISEFKFRANFTDLDTIGNTKKRPAPVLVVFKSAETARKVFSFKSKLTRVNRYDDALNEFEQNRFILGSQARDTLAGDDECIDHFSLNCRPSNYVNPNDLYEYSKPMDTEPCLDVDIQSDSCDTDESGETEDGLFYRIRQEAEELVRTFASSFMNLSYIRTFSNILELDEKNEPQYLPLRQVYLGMEAHDSMALLSCDPCVKQTELDLVYRAARDFYVEAIAQIKARFKFEDAIFEFTKVLDPKVVVTAATIPIEKCEPSKIPYKIADDEFCDKFTLCEAGKPTEMSCPDGLMFDFRRGKCDMPHVVNCESRTKTQNPRSTLNCPRENGMFEVEGTCNQFYHCTDGRHTLITCPEGVIFEPKVGACIHPDLSNRKNCSAAEILSFECPNRQHRFRRLKFGDHDRLPHPETCRMFIMCLMTGEPRLGGCSMGLVFNPKTGRCDLPKNVKGCENFYGVEEEEDSSEAGLPGFGSFVDDGVAASKDRAAELISESSRPEGRQRKVIKKMKIKA
ncbi:hypothetical protein QYM36_005357 [Artemia franciscana]|uniref:Chitin-binding type-2 domain-containing protein n=1 Tax=Artemia franciscana TaxID=6661 RepID=A0AA88I7P4_ARTSF|nr:hypothetical protein QYM36_005357 [Artemia franciscana]